MTTTQTPSSCRVSPTVCEARSLQCARNAQATTTLHGPLERIDLLLRSASRLNASVMVLAD